MSALPFQLLKLWPSARDFDAEQTKPIENPIPFGCELRVLSNFCKKKEGVAKNTRRARLRGHASRRKHRKLGASFAVVF